MIGMKFLNRPNDNKLFNTFLNKKEGEKNSPSFLKF
jgi:hypothetical protein